MLSMTLQGDATLWDVKAQPNAWNDYFANLRTTANNTEPSWFDRAMSSIKSTISSLPKPTSPATPTDAQSLIAASNAGAAAGSTVFTAAGTLSPSPGLTPWYKTTGGMIGLGAGAVGVAGLLGYLLLRK